MNRFISTPRSRTREILSRSSVRAQMGKVPDTHLAKALGVSVGALAKVRNSLGIPAFKPVPKASTYHLDKEPSDRSRGVRGDPTSESISVRLTEYHVQLMDSVRGDLSRSEFARRAIDIVSWSLVKD